MTNTYSINTTRGEEFSVADDLRALGLKPWLPLRLASRKVKEKRDVVWYDVPYVPKLMFCVIPAIYWRDMMQIKHIIGKPQELSRLGIEGIKPHRKAFGDDGKPKRDENGKPAGRFCEGKPGLVHFKEAVEAEYADAQRLRENNEYQCLYTPGQALELLDGAFQGLTGPFLDAVRRAHDDYAKIRVEVELMGRKTTVEVDPDKVRAYS